MLPKIHALDPGRWLTEHGVLSSAIPIIKDRYIMHHGNLGGAAYIFLQNRATFPKAIETLGQAPGVEEVYASAEAASKFHLHPDRIGDILVLADRDTVFGELPETEMPVAIRSHGSRHESDVPIIGYNSRWSANDFRYNVDVGHLYQQN